MRPSFVKFFGPQKQRAQGKPGVRCTRSRACSVESTRVSHHRFTGSIRLSPRNGFNGFLRALPGDRAFLPPSSADFSANLTPASGRQDHATSLSAGSAFVKGAARVHRVPPRVRDDREPPLCGTGRRICRVDFSNGKSGIFFASGLDIDRPGARFDLPDVQISSHASASVVGFTPPWAQPVPTEQAESETAAHPCQPLDAVDRDGRHHREPAATSLHKYISNSLISIYMKWDRLQKPR
jgi:hypothetical protein